MIKAEDTTKVMSMTKAAATIKAEDTTKVMSKSIAARLEKIHNDLSRRQTEQDAWYNALLAFTPESNLMTLKYKVKKMEVPEENYGRLSLADLEERFQALFQWEKELKERNMVLQQKRELMLEWVRTSFLPDFIENKLYSVWRYRTNVVRTGGNTVIDPYISLNSAGAFIPYFPRALQIGFLSPFPSEWFRTGSTPATTIGKRAIGGVMIFFYICLAFFIWGLWEYRKSLEFWIITIHSTFGIIVFTYVYPNVGSLSRMRYGFYMVIIGMGVAFAVQKLIESRQKIQPPSSKAEPGLKQRNEPT
ncbi:MAG: hypothetical protein KKH45_04310, partial [Proteobacteria bacterium]|nr:hypothetical protein [Pseudomonadota bacterium]